LKWLLGGLSFFAVLGTGMKMLEPEKRTPWAPKQLPQGFVPPEVSKA